jgi:hypothetical protein
MLVKLTHPLKPKPEPVKALKPYMSKTCCTIGGNPDLSEYRDMLKCDRKPIAHVVKIDKQRQREISEARKMARAKA